MRVELLCFFAMKFFVKNKNLFILVSFQKWQVKVNFIRERQETYLQQDSR
jgi:hypothetical protein